MSKGKQVEVTSARIRLDETLQFLVDRKEDSPVDEIDVTSISQDTSFRELLSSPKKLGKVGRKRKRLPDSSDGESPDDQSVVMKLFDRSVDLALFPENTPLYPVCRAWIQNRPLDKTLGTLGKEHIQEDQHKPKVEDEANYIYELPFPIKTEDGEDLRIPEPLPQPQETLDIHADPRTSPPAERLLLDHMARWKTIRQRWHTASQLNEMRYADSLDILRNMYERSMMLENT